LGYIIGTATRKIGFWIAKSLVGEQMEKEVFGKHLCTCLFSFLLLASCVSLVLAEPTGGGSTGGPRATFGTAPVLEHTAAGYWILETETSAGTQVHYIPKGESSLLPADYTDLDDLFSRNPAVAGTFLDLVSQPDTAGWEIPIYDPATGNNVYKVFKIPELITEEARFLVFALDPAPFKIADTDENAYPSHGGTPSFVAYHGLCTECNVLDDDEKCDAFFPSFNSCLRINILDRRDCSVFADQMQPFCEGVTGVGWNKGKEDPAPTGKPGYSGCQQEPDTLATGRYYGRDWYNELTDEAAIDILSSDFMGTGIDKASIGRCCGNDPEDLGALAVDKQYADSYPNAYLCYNDSKSNVNGDLKWSYAQESGKQYNIVTIEKDDSKFDAISNTNNWFICNTGDDALAGVYAPVGPDDAGGWSGVLVSEYSGLPEPLDMSAGTTLLGGEEGEWTGDDVSTTGWDGETTNTYANDIIDEETFSSERYDVDGASEVTACDQDGDGYEGPWTSDSSSPWHDASGNCDDPQPPFDCDDTMDDAIPNLARMRHPGRIDYCLASGSCGSTQGDCDLDCEPSTPCVPDPEDAPDPEDMLTNPEAKFFNPRFICHNVDKAGEFAECCSWDLGYCLNSAKGRREGAAVHTLREFDHYNTVFEGASSKLNKTNFVLRYGIDVPDSSEITEDSYYRLSLRADNNDLKIKDWAHYKNLEFYIWFTANYEVELWVGKFVGGEETTPDDAGAYVYPFKARITDYVVNEPGLRKWLHVVIPIDDIFAVPFEPEMIVFASNAKKLKDLGTVVTWTGGSPFSNVVGIDKILLLPKEEDMPADADNLYCSGTWPPVWLKDLDSKKVPDGATGDQPEGRNACEAIPSYGWTGSMCCGDDTGEDTDSDRIGPATFKEFYTDDNAGCWSGNVLADNGRVMLVKYNISSSTYSGEITRSCTNRTCTYDLPPIPGVFVTNKYADVYDLAFVDGGYTPIGTAAVSPTEDSYLKAENVPLQVLYLDGEYWGCNAADFIHDIDNTVDGGALIPPANFLNSEGDSCVIKGDYFCDPEDGENSGWNSQALIRYPASNLTMIDGTEIELGSGTNVNATMRILAKRNYNLIDDGGFENV
jgi:hypothetical protein